MSIENKFTFTACTFICINHRNSCMSWLDYFIKTYKKTSAKNWHWLDMACFNNCILKFFVDHVQVNGMGKHFFCMRKTVTIMPRKQERNDLPSLLSWGKIYRAEKERRKWVKNCSWPFYAEFYYQNNACQFSSTRRKDVEKC